MTNKVTVLIGPPCVGKSTYLNQIERDFVISSDGIVEILCRQHNLKYHEYFNLSVEHQVKRLHDQIFAILVQQSKSFGHVVWDLTNLTRRSRARIFTHYPKARFLAVEFDDVGGDPIRLEKTLLTRNRQRNQACGKYINESALRHMIHSFERVDDTEKFSQIIKVDVN